MIAEYQVDKLRQRLSQQVKGVGYHSFRSMKTSSYTFKYDGKWYRLSVKVEELPLDSSSNNDSVKFQNKY
jgi:hemolysin activation/secretion protein